MYGVLAATLRPREPEDRENRIIARPLWTRLLEVSTGPSAGEFTSPPLLKGSAASQTTGVVDMDYSWQGHTSGSGRTAMTNYIGYVDLRLILQGHSQPAEDERNKAVFIDQRMDPV